MTQTVVFPEDNMFQLHDFARANLSGLKVFSNENVRSNNTVDLILQNMSLHKKILNSSTDADTNYFPIIYVSFSRDEGAWVAESSSQTIPQIAVEHYEKIESQLREIAQSHSDPVVEKEAAETAISVVKQLKNRWYAPPEISFHGGDAVVMLWVLADTTYAITVTEGELGFVVRRNRKAVRMMDSIKVEQFQLEDGQFRLEDMR